MGTILKASGRARSIQVLKRALVRPSVALIVVLELAGYATTTNVKLPNPAEQSSVIEYVRDLRLATATLGDAALTAGVLLSWHDYQQLVGGLAHID